MCLRWHWHTLLSLCYPWDRSNSSSLTHTQGSSVSWEFFANKQQFLGHCSVVILCSLLSSSVQTVGATWDQHPQQDPHPAKDKSQLIAALCTADRSSGSAHHGLGELLKTKTQSRAVLPQGQEFWFLRSLRFMCDFVQILHRCRADKWTNFKKLKKLCRFFSTLTDHQCYP